MVAMLIFGIVMGLIFPVYSYFFVTFKDGMFWYFFMGCLGAGLFVGGFSYLLVNKIVFSMLKKITITVDSLARGDLTVECNPIESEDEIGAFSVSLCSLHKSLSDIVGLQFNIVNDLTVASSSLTGIATNLSDNFKEVVKNTTVVTEIAAVMDKSMHSVGTTSLEINTNTENIFSSSNEITESVNEVNESLKDIVSNMDKINLSSREAETASDSGLKIAEETSITIEQLGEYALEIGNVTDVIKSIADQTNLLAINATIEAAHAGEAGKSFVVVANEIKELASQSTVAAEKIATQIDAVQKGTKDAVGAIENVKVVVNEINSSEKDVRVNLDTQIDSIEKISSDIGSVTELISKISQNVSELAQGNVTLSQNITTASASTTDVVENCNSVKTGIVQNSEDAESVLVSAKELTGTANEVKKILGRFKIDN